MSSFTIVKCRSLVKTNTAIRKLVAGWSDVPIIELCSDRHFGNFLRRLVIRAVKELN